MPGGGIVWKLSLTPSAAPAVVAGITDAIGGEAFYDWAGGLVWLCLPRADDACAEVVRGAVGEAGHATLIRAQPEVRARVPVFQPQAAALARLTARVKQSFDPVGILNPGRMYEGV